MPEAAWLCRDSTSGIGRSGPRTFRSDSSSDTTAQVRYRWESLAIRENDRTRDRRAWEVHDIHYYIIMFATFEFVARRRDVFPQCFDGRIFSANTFECVS